MDKAIFELRFFLKILLTPTGNKWADLYSTAMNTDLHGMDIHMFNRKRAELAKMQTWKRDELVYWCSADSAEAIFFSNPQNEAYQNITDEQYAVLQEMMTFFLLEYKDSGDELLQFCRDINIELLVQIIVVLLVSNMRAQCVAWIQQYLPELKAMRTDIDNSILHLALKTRVGQFSIEPIIRLFVERLKMDVNVKNIMRQTPLHVLSNNVRDLLKKQKKPTDEMMQIAELLIDNGAHMDAMDTNGLEASSVFSKMVPKWSFNSSLKCLAAKAVLKHGIKFDRLPPQLATFVLSHKPGYIPVKSKDKNKKKN